MPPHSQAPSLLEELFGFLQEAARLRISFEDLSGVLSDVPDLALPPALRVHSCEFCEFAKSTRATRMDCITNKLVANRIAARQLEGFHGQCHLGLTDLVEPLIHQGRLLGIFYYGSVLLDGTEPLARQRIAKYCRRRGLSPAPFLTHLKSVPRVDEEMLVQARARLRMTSTLCSRILEAYGLPIERYRTEFDAYFTSRRRFSPLAQATIRYVHLNYRKPIRLTDAAAHVKCHPDYLSKALRKQFGCGFGDYVNRVRIDHARRLITTGRFSLGEIAFQVGFNDQSYFNKVFKALLGCTPGEYLEGSSTSEPIDALGEDRPARKNEWGIGA